MTRPSKGRLYDCLTVTAAASFLGISPYTPRNRDKAGKLCRSRHPISGYRRHRRDQLEGLPAEARGSG